MVIDYQVLMKLITQRLFLEGIKALYVRLFIHVVSVFNNKKFSIRRFVHTQKGKINQLYNMSV